MGALRSGYPGTLNTVKEKFSFQFMFNFCIVLFIFLISVGFWKCSEDVKRLTKSTEYLEQTLIEFTERLKPLDSNSDTNQASRNVKLVYETLSDNRNEERLRNVFKRSLPTYKTYDPLSSKPEVSNYYMLVKLFLTFFCSQPATVFLSPLFNQFK